jgi:epoxyqueuosine reductase QueG
MFSILDRHAIGQLLRTKEIDAWGVAANTPRLPLAPDYPNAISMLMRVDQLVVRGLRHGPTEDYYEKYLRLNVALDDASGTLVEVLRVHGHAAERVVATGGDAGNGHRPFPHKTAATSAGLGWIGKTALFVSPQFGPAVRLATVFTDLDLPVGDAIAEGRCGDCRACWRSSTTSTRRSAASASPPARTRGRTNRRSAIECRRARRAPSRAGLAPRGRAPATPRAAHALRTCPAPATLRFARN